MLKKFTLKWNFDYIDHFLIVDEGISDILTKINILKKERLFCLIKNIVYLIYCLTDKIEWNRYSRITFFCHNGKIQDYHQQNVIINRKNRNNRLYS